MGSLPPELWSHICLFLAPPDLAHLALTSFRILDSARRALYHTVVLDNAAQSVQNTVSLLRSDHHLCRQVRKIVLISSPGLWDIQYWQGYRFSTWFDPGIFGQMSALESVHFHGWPAGDATIVAQSQAFRDMLSVIYSTSRSLTSVRLEDVTLPADSDEFTNHRPLQCLKVGVPVVSRIHSVTVKVQTSGGFPWSFIIPTFFFRSPSPLEYLELSFSGRATPQYDFSTLSFPRLRTLHFSNLPRTASRAMTSFLLAHPSLRYLHLLQSDLVLDVNQLKINMLPDLHTISASPALLVSLGARCDSLRYIRCLYLDCDSVERLDKYQHMVDVVKGFPNLRHIAVSRTMGDTMFVAELMALFYASVELECWSGGFYVRDLLKMDAIAQVISIFPALARLNICEWTYPHVSPLGETTHMRALHDLARAAHMLKKIALYQVHLPTNEITAVYVVDTVSAARGPGFALDKASVGPGMGLGVAQSSTPSPRNARSATRKRTISLRQTYQYVDGGPHIKERRKVDFASIDWESETPLITTS